MRNVTLRASIHSLLDPREQAAVPGVRIPLMLFAGMTKEGEPVTCSVSWEDDVGLQCDCSGEAPCLHVLYVETERRQNDGQIMLIPNSVEVSREEMESLVLDLPRLRKWMLERLPVIDISNDEWLRELERSWTSKPN